MKKTNDLTNTEWSEFTEKKVSEIKSLLSGIPINKVEIILGRFKETIKCSSIYLPSEGDDFSKEDSTQKPNS